METDPWSSDELLFNYSFDTNNIGDTGAQALAEGLKGRTNLQTLL